jgi:hypothetical protein
MAKKKTIGLKVIIEILGTLLSIATSIVLVLSLLINTLVPVESVGGSHNLTFTGNLLLILGAITFLSFIFIFIVLRLTPKDIYMSKVYTEL